MRLRVFAAIMTAGILVGSYCSAEGSPFEVGAKIGINGAGVWGEGADEWGSRSGLCLGGLAAYRANRLFGVQGELLYTRKGARLEGADTTELRIDYLEIPVLFRLSTVGGGSFCCIPMPGGRRTDLYLGPALGIKVGSSIKTQSGGVTTEEDADVKTLDVEAAIGVSTGYGSETFFAFADFRFTVGLLSVYTLPSGSDVTNYAASMAMGIAFTK